MWGCDSIYHVEARIPWWTGYFSPINYNDTKWSFNWAIKVDLNQAIVGHYIKGDSKTKLVWSIFRSVQCKSLKFLFYFGKIEKLIIWENLRIEKYSSSLRRNAQIHNFHNSALKSRQPFSFGIMKDAQVFLMKNIQFPWIELKLSLITGKVAIT